MSTKENRKKRKAIKGVKVSYIDYNGNDISHLIKHSYIYNGVPGGFYVENNYPDKYIWKNKFQ